MDAADGLETPDVLRILGGGGRKADVVAGSHHVVVQQGNSHTPPVIHSLYRFLALRGLKTSDKKADQLYGRIGWRFPDKEDATKRSWLASWFEKQPKIPPDHFAVIYDGTVGVSIDRITLVTHESRFMDDLRRLADEIKRDQRFKQLHCRVSLEAPQG